MIPVIQSSGLRPRHLKLLIESLDTGCGVIIDNSGSSWNGCKKALEMAIGINDSHVLILQEDVIVCRDFVKSVENLTGERPHDLIRYFSPHKWKKPINECQSFVYAQAYSMPKVIAEAILEFESDNPKDDGRINEYLSRHNILHLVAYPSWVEHLGWQHSTTRHEKSKLQQMTREARMAGNFIGLETSPERNYD